MTKNLKTKNLKTKRIALIVVAVLGVLVGGYALYGLVWPGDAQDQAGGQQAGDGKSPQTRIVQALLGAVDEAEADAKAAVRQSLREADAELGRVLGDNSRRLIEQANRKPPTATIDPQPRPAVKENSAPKNAAP